MRAPDGSPIPTSQTAWTRPSTGPSIGWITCWPAMKAGNRTSTAAPRSVATPTSELNRGQPAVDVHRQTAHSDDPDTQSETADRDPRGQRHDRKRYASLLGAAACTRGATLSRRRLPSSSESLPTRAMASGPGSVSYTHLRAHET